MRCPNGPTGLSAVKGGCMKKKKTKKRAGLRASPLANSAPTAGFLGHRGKAMLLTASYQLFSLFLGGGGAQAVPPGPDSDEGIHDEGPLLGPLVSPYPGDPGSAPIRLTCIGCTTGPDNVPCAGTGCSCTGCVGRQSSPRENTYPSEREQRYNRAEGIYRQGNALFYAGRYREALDAYLQAKSVYPSGWSQLELAIARARAMIDVTDARDAARAGDYRNAARLMREAVTNDPDNAHLWKKELEDYERLATRFVSDAHAALDRGDYAQAEKILTNELNTRPDSFVHYGDLGRALLGLGRLQEAEGRFRRAIQLKPQEPAWHYDLGLALKKQNRPAEAEEAFRQALRVDPNFSHARRELERTQSTSEMHKAISGFTQTESRPPAGSPPADLDFMGGPRAGEQLKSVEKHSEDAAGNRNEPAKEKSNLGFDTGGKPGGTLGAIVIDGSNPFKEPVVPKENRTKEIAALEKKRDEVKKKRMELQQEASKIEQKPQKTTEETMKLVNLKQEVSKVSDEERFLNFSIKEELRKPPRSREKKDDPVPPPRP
jgi:tetratricopeptide (TPR) repeat protein